MKKIIPNALTLSNLFFGFSACIMASQDNIEAASLLILCSMVFDFLDGFAARLLKAYSDLGKELDSLSDLVSFGVAPAMILFSLLSRNSLALSVMIIIAALIPLASALRLAKFNNDQEQKYYFKGMPTPASALVVVAIVISSVYGNSKFVSGLVSNVTFLTALSVFLSVMMLVNVRMLSLKFTSMKFKGNEDRFILIGLSLLSLVIFRLNALLVIITIYIILSLVMSVIRALKGSSGA
ncbi:MAG TPA: CDP-diacylglycerol--serine O-phosphatidyltransferase [Bacteroidales bacterium]|nr:CDP-diacylglycerol--serine O-phosphatidyltransferase [Bacteroidales bacterium]HPT11413.1 CDP-diacylglycerol--serine O-phosphatidyltransferase [Bacteroidales bacterium]